MDLYEAIETRISCRAYDGCPVEPEKVAVLQEEVDRINAESGLHIQLYGPREDGFVIEMNQDMFAGDVPMYAAVVGLRTLDAMEKAGYYGERLVLLATALGLGTCWVRSTYNHDTARAELAEGEELLDVIPIGYAPAEMPAAQQEIRANIRARDKKLEMLYRGPVALDEAPEWIRIAIRDVQLGPSAVNRQPIAFTQESADAPVRAIIADKGRLVSYVDLGIAKLHFELSAAAHGMPGTWEWGEGGAFVLA